MVAVAPISVVPRAISPLTGESVPLLDVVEEFCDTHTRGALVILGPGGAGKTTALAYLAAASSQLDDVDWLDQPPLQAALAASLYRRVVLTMASPLDFDGLTVHLAPWTRDELIEFLLAECPDRCESVMRRVRNWECNAALLPIFWSTVLRTLASDDSVRDVRGALQHHLRATVRTPDARRIVGEYCLAKELAGFQYPANWPSIKDELARETQAIISIRPVRLMLAAEAVVDRLVVGDTEILRYPSASEYFVPQRSWPAALLEYVAEHVVARPALLGVLRRALEGDEREHQAAASLVVRVDRCWRPTRKLHRSSLGGADLRGVDWSGLDLSDFDLGSVNLSSADLARARLRGVGLAPCAGADDHRQGSALPELFNAQGFPSDYAIDMA